MKAATEKQKQVFIYAEAIAEIKKTIEEQLIKRGYFAPITVAEEFDRFGNQYLTLTSAPFQTQPVMFRELSLQHFGSSIAPHPEHEGYYRVWMTVSVFWRTFDRGSNGTELFSFNCAVSPDGDRAFDISIR